MSEIGILDETISALKAAYPALEVSAIETEGEITLTLGFDALEINIEEFAHIWMQSTALSSPSEAANFTVTILSDTVFDTIADAARFNGLILVPTETLNRYRVVKLDDTIRLPEWTEGESEND